MTATERAVSILAVVCALSAPRLARAQTDPLAANTLFEHGKELMDAGRYEEACKAFAESQRLDPAGGTLLRLALCEEKRGKLATAAFDFHEVVRVSKEASGDAAKLAERIRIAEQELAVVEPKVPKLLVNVPQASRLSGLTVTANGLPRTEETWGIAIPIDPGDVAIEARAPDHAPFDTTVRVSPGESASVNVPLLSSSDAPPPPAAPPPVADAPQHASLQRPIAAVVAGLGLVSLGVGSYFGVRAISKWNDANAACPGTSCAAPAVSLADDAKSAAVAADITIGVGILAVAVGVVLWVTGAPKSVRPGVGSVAVAF